MDILKIKTKKTKYFSGKKDNSYTNAAPTFDEYDR